MALCFTAGQVHNLIASFNSGSDEKAVFKHKTDFQEDVNKNILRLAYKKFQM